MTYRVSRRGRLIALGLATLALVATGWLAMRSVAELDRLRSRAELAHTELSQLRGLLPKVQQREQYLQQSQQISAMIERIKVDPAHWANRRVKRAAGVLSRQETAQLLQQQLGGAQQWFAAERFDLSVTNPSAGLFNAPTPDEKGFNVELAGVVYFPLNAP